MNTRRSQQTNPIQVRTIVRWVTVALLLGMTGLTYVYIKNQQHALGSQTREVERLLRETRAFNQALGAQITSMTSRAALQQKLAEGRIALVPVQSVSIARLGVPVLESEGSALGPAATVGVVERYHP